MSRYFFKKNLLVVILLFVLVGAFVLYRVYEEYGPLCIARTGQMPDSALFINDTLFVSQIESVRESALSSLVSQFDATTGLFTYLMHPHDVHTTGEDNDIRQLLGSRILALEGSHDAQILSLHRQNLDTIFRDWYQEENGEGYVYVDQKSKLGANAMLLRVLVASPDYALYEDEAEALARGMYALMREDGSFVPWYKEPTYEYDADYLLTFYSGEAILALLEYWERSGDEEAFLHAQRAQDFYIARYVGGLEDHYYPAYVPWHTLSLSKLYEETDEERYAEAIFILTDKLLEMLDREVFVGRFYSHDTPQYGSPHASSDAVYTEGLAVAHKTALRAGREERANAYREALTLAVSRIESLQYHPSWLDKVRYGDRAERIAGGITTNACSQWVRVDTTAHTIDALTQLIGLAKI